MSDSYKIGSLARLTGFSPALLRAWERRYGLLAPTRGAGSQRVYGEDDLRVLRYVRRQLDQGRSIGEVAQPGRAALVARAAADAEATPPAVIGSPAARPGTAAPGPAGIDAWRGSLVEAAQALDGQGIAATLDEVFAGLGPDRAVDDVIVPVATAVGDLWAAGRCSVAGEHLISDHLLHRVRRLLDAAQPTGPAAPRVIAACLPDEQHQLGLAILAWKLARRGIRVVYLGAAVPIDDLVRAWRAARPHAVVLSVTRTPTLDAHRDELLARCAADMRGATVFVGGQAVAPDAAGRPRRKGVIFLPPSLPNVVDRIAAAVA